jgi:hypothetical protein
MYPFRTLALRRMLVGFVILSPGAAISAQTEMSARPSCEGSTPQPGYAPVGAPPNVQIWKDQSRAGFPSRASCALILLKPGGLRSVYFIDQHSPGIWSYYSLTRIAESSWLIAGHEQSSRHPGMG